MDNYSQLDPNNVSSASLLPVLYRVLCLPPLFFMLLWCWFRWKYRKVISHASKLAVERVALPFIGHMYQIFYGLKGMMALTVDSGKALARRHNKTTCLWIGPYPLIFVNDPDDIYTLVTSSKTSEKSSEYAFLNFFLGNGLLVAPGIHHRITRRHINPMFLPRNLEQLFPVFNTSARHLVRDLTKLVDVGEVDVLETVTKTGLRNVLCVMFGADFKVDTESEDFQNYSKTLEEVSAVMVERVVKPWLWSDTLFYFFWRRRIDQINNTRKKFTASVVQDYVSRKKNIIQKKMLSGDQEITEPKQPLNLLDAFEAIQKTHPDISEEDLDNEILTLSITGTESTKAAVSSCMLALAANPDIQDRLYEEIVSMVGAGDSDMSQHDLNNMPYLDQVYKETIRYFTVVPVFARKTLQDVEFKEVTVPAGSTVACNLMGLHFNSTVFPDPETFDPDHFSPERVADMKRYTFLPFSGGSRSCIGKVYATMFMKTLIVHILRKYRLKTSVDIKTLRFNMSLAMISESGYHIDLQHRNPTK